jgi:tetratricopeptide (TPR) repeat protein
VGLDQLFLGREDEARAEFERALALDPTYVLTLIHASWLYWTERDTAAFFAVHERLEAVAERGGVPAATLRAAYGPGGPDSMARLQLASTGAGRRPMDRAKWHVLLGDLDAAFADLDQAARERNPWLPFETQLPIMAPLRADPRYETLMKRMGLR